jgi:hypothetical protein
VVDTRSRGVAVLREPSGGRNGVRGKEGNGGDRQPIKLARRNEMEGEGTVGGSDQWAERQGSRGADWWVPWSFK